LPGHSLFAVYDGHGGKNAAIFAAKHILNVLQETDGFAAYVADQVRMA
jgi:serine/threonine protein phosphatase PrpC